MVLRYDTSIQNIIVRNSWHFTEIHISPSDLEKCKGIRLLFHLENAYLTVSNSGQDMLLRLLSKGRVRMKRSTGVITGLRMSNNVSLLGPDTTNAFC